MDRSAIASECISDIVKSVGRIIGVRLALSMIKDPLETNRTLYKEIKGYNIKESSVEIRIEKADGRRFTEIMFSLITGISKAYSGVLGQVADTLIKKSVASTSRKYGIQLLAKK